MRLPRHTPSWRAELYIVLPVILALVAATSPLVAQTPERPPLQRLFGVGDDEFFKGAWIKNRPDTALAPDSTLWWHAYQIWEVADKLGIDIIRIQGMDIAPSLTDSIIAQRTRPTQRIISTHIGDDFHKVSVARELNFYTFTGRDSVEYRSWPARFINLAGGVTVESPIATQRDMFGGRALEQHYRSGALAPNTMIAQDIAFDIYPEHRYRWKYENGDLHPDTMIYNAFEFLADMWHLKPGASTQFVVVTGHLFPDGSRSSPNDSILRIDVIYEIPRGQRYVDVTARTPGSVVAGSNIERNLATLYVRKRDLMPENGRQPTWNEYREVALGFDARWASGSISGRRTTGPLYPGNESRRINLRVTWIGNEDIAIRSIALRDSLGQVVLGRSGRDTAGQAALLAGALRDVRFGLSLDPSNLGKAKWPIIARAPTIESQPMHAPAFNLLTKLIHDSVSVYDSINRTRDGMTVWNEVNTNKALFQRWNSDANPGMMVPDAVVSEIGIGTQPWLDRRVGVRNGRIPSIEQHNGGRFDIPLLEIRNDEEGREDIEYGYESTLQLLGFRQYIPYRLDHDMELFMHFEVGRAAEVARDLRRRLIIVPFSVGAIHINYDWRTNRPTRDVHSMMHFPEPAEMRTMMNLGLCYGAKGVLWQVIDGHYALMSPENLARDEKGTFRFAHFDDFGVHSPLARGPNLDRFPEFRFVQSSGLHGYGDTTSYATIRNFFTGWNIRSRALTDIHRWIDQVGPELMKLDWQDGYSIHFTDIQPHQPDLRFRPLADTLIVRQVRSRQPGSVRYDSTHRTFVELGFFFPKNSTADRRRDTSHIFLVNRRCFERTEDIPLTSDTGRTMDTLAETRTIEVTLRLGRPAGMPFITSRAEFIRVQEIAPDTTRLPLTNEPRLGLDTIVDPNSTFSITLGPGRAALLRLMTVGADTSLINEAIDGIDVGGEGLLGDRQQSKRYGEFPWPWEFDPSRNHYQFVQVRRN